MNLRIRVGNSIRLTNSDVSRALPESTKLWLAANEGPLVNGKEGL